MESYLARVIGANVRRVRLGRGASQMEFAETLDMHRTMLSDIERGRRNLSLRTVERLAERLDIPPTRLLREPSGLVLAPSHAPEAGRDAT